MIKIGFWKNNAGTEEGRNEVNSFHGSMDDAETKCIIKYIEASEKGMGYMGWASCRACGDRLGSRDMSTPDGKFMFPQGYEHYILKHYVRPPEEFIRAATEWLNGGLGDQQRWLNDEEVKAYNSRHLLPPPGAEAVEQWAKWLCTERDKLAHARGTLYTIQQSRKEELEELDSILDYTKGK